MSLSVAVLVYLSGLVLVLVAPVHVGGVTFGFLFPTPRWTNLNTPLVPGICSAYGRLGDPKTTLYYGRNQIVVRSGEFEANNVRQLRLYGYVNSNSLNQSAPSSSVLSAGSYGGVSWSYDESSVRVLTSVYNSTEIVGTPPAPGQRFYDQIWEIDIPQGTTCTPHCTLQAIGTTSGSNGVSVSAVNCADVWIEERRPPTCVYMTLRPDGCCPLEPLSISRRLYEMFASNTSINPFAATAYPLWDYPTDMSYIVSNIWYIDSTAPNTFKINPQTGYYSVKLCIHPHYNNQTAQTFLNAITNTQLVSSALSPDSRGTNNSYVWWGDVPNTYVNGANGKSMNAATSSSSVSLTFIYVATLLFGLFFFSR